MLRGQLLNAQINYENIFLLFYIFALYHQFNEIYLHRNQNNVAIGF